MKPVPRKSGRRPAQRSKSGNGKAEAELARELEREEERDGPTFGRRFFVNDLAPLLREQCPDPSKNLPRVFVHVLGGDVLEVCRVIAIAPHWVSLSVIEDDGGMRTEIVPYGTIARITITDAPADAPIGFRDQTPEVVAPARKKSRTRARVSA